MLNYEIIVKVIGIYKININKIAHILPFMLIKNCANDWKNKIIIVYILPHKNRQSNFHTIHSSTISMTNKNNITAMK